MQQIDVSLRRLNTEYVDFSNGVFGVDGSTYTACIETVSFCVFVRQDGRCRFHFIELVVPQAGAFEALRTRALAPLLRA